MGRRLEPKDEWITRVVAERAEARHQRRVNAAQAAISVALVTALTVGMWLLWEWSGG